MHRKLDAAVEQVKRDMGQQQDGIEQRIEDFVDKVDKLAHVQRRGQL